MYLIAGNVTFHTLDRRGAALGGSVPAALRVDCWHDLAPSGCGEEVLGRVLVEITCLDRELESMAELDIGLGGVIIEDVVLILELVVKGLEEGAAELADAMEGGVDVSYKGVPLLNGRSDQVGVGQVHAWHGKVELIGLGSLPHGVLVISAEGVENTQLVPPGAQLGRGFQVEAADVRSHHGDAEEVEPIQAINRCGQPLFLGPVVSQPVESPLLDSRRARS